MSNSSSRGSLRTELDSLQAAQEVLSAPSKRTIPKESFQCYSVNACVTLASHQTPENSAYLDNSAQLSPTHCFWNQHQVQHQSIGEVPFEADHRNASILCPGMARVTEAGVCALGNCLQRTLMPGIFTYSLYTTVGPSQGGQIGNESRQPSYTAPSTVTGVNESYTSVTASRSDGGQQTSQTPAAQYCSNTTAFSESTCQYHTLEHPLRFTEAATQHTSAPPWTAPSRTRSLSHSLAHRAQDTEIRNRPHRYSGVYRPQVQSQSLYGSSIQAGTQHNPPAMRASNGPVAHPSSLMQPRHWSTAGRLAGGMGNEIAGRRVMQELREGHLRASQDGQLLGDCDELVDAFCSPAQPASSLNLSTTGFVWSGLGDRHPLPETIALRSVMHDSIPPVNPGLYQQRTEDCWLRQNYATDYAGCGTHAPAQPAFPVNQPADSRTQMADMAYTGDHRAVTLPRPQQLCTSTDVHSRSESSRSSFLHTNDVPWEYDIPASPSVPPTAVSRPPQTLATQGSSSSSMLSTLFHPTTFSTSALSAPPYPLNGVRTHCDQASRLGQTPPLSAQPTAGSTDLDPSENSDSPAMAAAKQGRRRYEVVLPGATPGVSGGRPAKLISLVLRDGTMCMNQNAMEDGTREVAPAYNYDAWVLAEDLDVSPIRRTWAGADPGAIQNTWLNLIPPGLYPVETPCSESAVNGFTLVDPVSTSEPPAPMQITSPTAAATGGHPVPRAVCDANLFQPMRSTSPRNHNLACLTLPHAGITRLSYAVLIHSAPLTATPPLLPFISSAMCVYRAISQR